MVFLEGSSLEQKTERQVLATIAFENRVIAERAFDALLGLMNREGDNYPEFDINCMFEQQLPTMVLTDIAGKMFDEFCQILTMNDIQYALDVTAEMDLLRAKGQRGSFAKRRDYKG